MILRRDGKGLFSCLLLRSSSSCHLRQIHAQIYLNGLHGDQFLVTHLISLCRRLGEARHALSAFSSTSRPTAYPLNALLEALAAEDSGLKTLSLDVYKGHLRECSTAEAARRPNLFTFSPLIRSCASGSKKTVQQVDAHVYKFGCRADAYVATSLLDCYSKCGDLGAARDLFDEMPERTVVSWNSMISSCARHGDVPGAQKLFAEMPERDEASWTCMLTGYSQNSFFDEALALFSEMNSAGVRLNGMAAVSVLSACGNLGALNIGREIHLLLKCRNRADKGLFSGASLIDMYSKCGVVEEALQVFDNMLEKNVVAFSAMIMGLATNGRCAEALGLFDRMRTTGLQPNGATFVGVLCACCHGGFVEAGWRYFQSMQRTYSIIPKLQHYTCMVDLLGRSGQVVEALQFIREMPVEPDVIVWGALLGACQVNGQVELGVYAAHRILQLDPQHSGSLVFLSGSCARVKDWNGVRKISRRLGASEKKKLAGKSWVEIDGVVHQFFAGDHTHPRSNEIFAMLEELALLVEENSRQIDGGMHLD